jgi:predicted aspartyl protease
MTKNLTGWVDHRRRPLINLQFWRDRKICAAIDTGFNGYLLWEGTPENLSEFPGELTSAHGWVEVAGGNILATLGTTCIHWFEDEGRFTRVDIRVAMSNKVRRRGDPVVFVGTALLSGLSLFVDFTAQILRIERSA